MSRRRASIGSFSYDLPKFSNRMLDNEAEMVARAEYLDARLIKRSRELALRRGTIFDDHCLDSALRATDLLREADDSGGNVLSSLLRDVRRA